MMDCLHSTLSSKATSFASARESFALGRGRCESPTSKLALKCQHSCNDVSASSSRPLQLARPIRKSLSGKPKDNVEEEEEEEERRVREKVEYMESIGVDAYAAVAANAAIGRSSTTAESMEMVGRWLGRMAGVPRRERGRLMAMCPHILTATPRQVSDVLTFLVREVGVPPPLLRKVIYRRPRLLGCSVTHELRPTLYFLQRLGLTDVAKYSFLLSCSVEDKLIPRLEFVQSLGFAYDDAVGMFLKFPALFNYSLEENLKPKFDYLVKDMGRPLDDLKAFPQYFAYSLEKKIKPRHAFLLQRNLHLPLPDMLTPSDAKFYRKFKNLHIDIHFDDEFQ